MRGTVRYPTINFLFIALLIGLSACAYGPRPQVLPPPPSEEVRAKLGTIGVVSARFTPEAKFDTPAKGRASGAWEGTKQGAVIGAAIVGAIGGVPLIIGAPIGIVTAGIGALAGGIVGTIPGSIHGAVTALPSETVEEAEAALKMALADLEVQEAMGDHVLQVAEDQTHHHLVLLTDQGPTTPDEEASYGSLTDNGIDTRLCPPCCRN